MKQILRKKISQGILMWVVLLICILIIYMFGENPLQAPIIVVGAIILPIILIILIIQYRMLYGSFFKPIFISIINKFKLIIDWIELPLTLLAIRKIKKDGNIIHLIDGFDKFVGKNTKPYKIAKEYAIKLRDKESPKTKIVEGKTKSNQKIVTTKRPKATPAPQKKK